MKDCIMLAAAGEGANTPLHSCFPAVKFTFESKGDWESDDGCNYGLFIHLSSKLFCEITLCHSSPIVRKTFWEKCSNYNLKQGNTFIKRRSWYII